jgi:hypothetical protein
MARKITFTQPEKTWLLHLLDNRIFQLSNSRVSAEKVIKAARSSRSKLLIAENVIHFTPFETALCTGCINEQMRTYYEGLQFKNVYDLLALNPEQKYLLEKIDMGKDMLFKLGYDRKTRFPEYNYEVRFRDTLLAIEKIRQAKEVCISRSGDHVYKIGFITAQNEVFTWRTSYDLGVHDVCTASKSTEQVNAIKKNFSLVTGRGAAALLLHADNKHDPSARFFKAILN